MDAEDWKKGLFDESVFRRLRSDISRARKSRTIRNRVIACRKIHGELQQGESRVEANLTRVAKDLQRQKIIDLDGICLDFGMRQIELVQEIAELLRAIPLYGPYAAWKVEEEIIFPFWNLIVGVLRHDLRIKATNDDFSEMKPYLPKPIRKNSCLFGLL